MARIVVQIPSVDIDTSNTGLIEIMIDLSGNGLSTTDFKSVEVYTTLKKIFDK